MGGDGEMKFGRMILGVTVLSLCLALGCSDDSTSVSSQRYSARLDSSFAVGDSSVLEISSFAGEVTVTPGVAGVVQVAAEKWAARQGDLDEITVEMVALQNGVHVEADNPSSLKSVSVDLEVTVPADIRPAIQLAAGSIAYEGLGEGACTFTTAAGTITLKLPADIDAEVYLSVAAGRISIDFPVVGIVKDDLVDGIIGSGADGRIVATVGAGQIIVTSQ